MEYSQLESGSRLGEDNDLFLTAFLAGPRMMPRVCCWGGSIWDEWADGGLFEKGLPLEFLSSQVGRTAAELIPPSCAHTPTWIGIERGYLKPTQDNHTMATQELLMECVPHDFVWSFTACWTWFQLAWMRGHTD